MRSREGSGAARQELSGQSPGEGGGGRHGGPEELKRTMGNPRMQGRTMRCREQCELKGLVVLYSRTPHSTIVVNLGLGWAVSLLLLVAGECMDAPSHYRTLGKL